jgi:hypothetical protein
MENYNKEWLNSANSYRPEPGANQLADRINATLGDLTTGKVTDPSEATDRLYKLWQKCLEYDWLLTARLLERLAAEISEDSMPDDDDHLGYISNLAYSEANASVKKDGDSSRE